MLLRKRSNAKETSIIAISAATYAVFFFLSYTIALPRFTILYLPVILLGVFPIWFGWSGLVGSMIGALIGGFFVEGLGFLAWIEAITTLIIYGLNWILIPKRATEEKTKSDLILLGIYTLTLFLGTSYILWQLTFFGVLPTGAAEVILLPTFALNLIIQWISCPILLRTLSGKLRNWGIYSGTFREWRNHEPLLES